ncbi:PREDICTED: uncharacterized protein LOC104609852 isoform X2 [Nelumbo nucifera]|uniref:Uncharacterized protein LOC104609852 isoform X2 n=1 Tax=Nelumbo nucifera TaxID=4432 RepID=A0A1U8B1H0_NELNU|nr:PREDICTED: uncharacterized protein LOC104609852 isoform X2 [Nelumbo nucifera]
MATEMSLKLLVDMNSKRVLFAEAEKEIVDFLFSLLIMPMGTIVRLLSPHHASAGCFGNLYNSVQNLGDMYLQPNTDKAPLLQPKIAYSPLTTGVQRQDTLPLLLLQDAESEQSKSTSPPQRVKYYRNSARICGHLSNVAGTRCPCGWDMNMELQLIEPKTVAAGARGYVKELVTYMITDDLVVTPMSTISSITLLSRLGVKGICNLEEVSVKLDKEQMFSLWRELLKLQQIQREWKSPL